MSTVRRGAVHVEVGAPDARTPGAARALRVAWLVSREAIRRCRVVRDEQRGLKDFDGAAMAERGPECEIVLEIEPSEGPHASCRAMVVDPANGRTHPFWGVARVPLAATTRAEITCFEARAPGTVLLLALRESGDPIRPRLLYAATDLPSLLGLPGGRYEPRGASHPG